MIETGADNPVLVQRDDDELRLTLNRPKRGNSLTLELLDALISALQTHGDSSTLIVTGAGRAFSTGGDIAGFLDHADTPARLNAYASELVGRLNTALIALADFPGLIIADVNGPLTGGSLGMMLVADHVMIDETAFIQPYYTRMGFAPDGGWTAILPQQIGTQMARNWLAMDSRWGATEVLAAGLAQDKITRASAEHTLGERLRQSKDLDRSVILQARRLIFCQALAPRLEAERQAFLEQISRDDTRRRMLEFVNTQAKPKKGAA